MKRKITILFLLVLLAGFTPNAFSQNFELPRLSPNAYTQQRIGLTDVTVSYCRPSIRGRKVWGKLVPYNTLWRTGANEATIVRFEDDVEIKGKILPKGSYSLFTVPLKKSEWIVKFNSDTTLWGTNNYSTSNDVLAVHIAPTKSEFHENLTFKFSDVTINDGFLDVCWEKKKIQIPIKVDVQKKALQNVFDAVADKNQKDYWRVLTKATEYCVGIKKELETATAWINQAIELEPDHYWPRWVKADLLALKKDYKGAIEHAEKAIELGVAKQGKAFTHKKKLQNKIDGWRGQTP